MPAIDNARCVALFDILAATASTATFSQHASRQCLLPADIDMLPGLSLAANCQSRVARLLAEDRTDDARATEEAHRQAVLHLRQNLYLQGHLKRELLARMPLEEAAAVIARALEAGSAPRLCRGRLLPMRDYLIRHGLSYAELDTPRRFSIPPAKIFAADSGAPVEVIGRTPFVGALSDAIVRHRSSLVRVGADLLLDADVDELDDIPIQLHVDPRVMDRREDDLVTLEPTEGPLVDLREAVHLGGVPSRAFGHWLAQFLLKYVAARSAGLLPAVPILIDAEMPKTHREALEFFVKDAPIIEVPEGASARVARLWVLGDWLYVPVCPAPNQDLGPRRLSLPPQATVEVIRKMLAGLEAPPTATIDKLYLARRPGLHRKMVNHVRIEQIAREMGFHVAYPEDLSFADQFAMIRGAASIVGPDGSSHIMNMFAKPGTKVTMLSHGFLENNASLAALLEVVGLDVLMLQGRCVRVDVAYRRFSDYEIDEAQFVAAVSR